jgi:hypothetical protein
MSRYKSAILVIGVLNLIAGIVAGILGPLSFAVAATVAMSWYRELDVRGVINHEKLAELHGASFDSDWSNVPDTMTSELGHLATQTCTILCFIMIVSGMLLCTFCGVDSWRTARARRRMSRGHCPQCNYDLTENESGTCPECGSAAGQAVGRRTNSTLK